MNTSTNSTSPASSASLQTIRGMVSPLPPGLPCRVCLVDGDTSYHVLPRGAGADLMDMLSTTLDVVGTVASSTADDSEEVKTLLVRSYTVLDLDEEAWLN